MSTVLVAEDDADLLELLVMTLESGGFTVSAHQDGNSALQATRATRFNAAGLDVAMPGLTGTELCRQLRANPQTATLPVILLTARGHSTDVTAGLAAGADEYMLKPFVPRDLLSRLTKLITDRP